MPVLILLILVLALAGGFLGTLLEVAFWAIVLLALVGALIGFGVWKALSGRGSAART